MSSDVPALSPVQRRVLSCLLDDLLAPDPPTPGAGEAGGADYVSMLLGSFALDPPRIWAGGPFSGRHGGAASFETFLELSGWETDAWRRRIEEWRVRYDDGFTALGDDYAELGEVERAARRDATDPAFLALAFEHGCESLYGDPVYGGNRGGSAWASIGFRGDSLPAGYTDAEVTSPDGTP